MQQSSCGGGGVRVGPPILTHLPSGRTLHLRASPTDVLRVRALNFFYSGTPTSSIGEFSYTYSSMCIRSMAITTSHSVSTMRLPLVLWLPSSQFEPFFLTFQTPIIILFAITFWCQKLLLACTSWVDFETIDVGRKWIRSLDWILTISWITLDAL